MKMNALNDRVRRDGERPAIFQNRQIVFKFARRRMRRQRREMLREEREYIHDRAPTPPPARGRLGGVKR
ncbi:MAG: hypothetical protein AB7T08_16105, partial [Hyphomonadaceae bacterium]